MDTFFQFFFHLYDSVFNIYIYTPSFVLLLFYYVGSSLIILIDLITYYIDITSFLLTFVDHIIFTVFSYLHPLYVLLPKCILFYIHNSIGLKQEVTWCFVFLSYCIDSQFQFNKLAYCTPGLPLIFICQMVTPYYTESYYES